MMKILTIRFFGVISFLFISNLLFSQELVEMPLTTNKVLIQKWAELQENSSLRAASITDTINLGTKGFLDDFSYEGPYPDSSLWLDNFVYVNRGFPISPVTIGAATFDGLNANGYPYNFNATTTSVGQADYLTSKPINLNYPASDSIYFSFYYQPQGRGNDPEQADSLVLQFKNSGGWKNVWAKKGSTLFSNDSSWTRVMIPIIDTAFLKNGFQFRFKNYATLSGSFDHWSIDYVYLKRFRAIGENLNDVSFVYNAPSLINAYTSMPWNHYQPSFMKTSIPILLRDNDVVDKNVSIYHNVYDQSGPPPVFSSPLTAHSIQPFTTVRYYTYTAGSLPVFAATTNPTKYTFETVINTSGIYDTLRREQLFSNYFAYDDGTAEVAFGLGGIVGALLAEKFTSTVADTLRCIDIYFNPAGTNATLYTFNFKVWNDFGGKPGAAIYTSGILSPVYNQTGNDRFTRYYLASPVYLGAGTFYIGFQQNTDKFLGVGVDKNINTQNQIFYNTTGTWMNSPNQGSLMMHPVFGSAASFVGMNALKKQDNSITVYPNPANDKLYIRSNLGNKPEKIAYTIIDMFGRSVLENTLLIDEPIDISNLSEGVYFIRTINGEFLLTTKFIKVN
ncbi:MAG: T9SS type A sorting domain-containing protein [Bacteroidota bacterium]